MALLNEWVDGRFLTKKGIATLRKRYAAALPFPHIAITGILKPASFAKLQTALQKQRFAKKEADLFSFSQTQDLRASKNPAIKSFIQLLNSKEFAQWLEAVTGVKTTAGRADAAGFIYADTDYLLCHDDRLSTRRVAYVLHCTALGKRQGGALALYASNANGEPTTVAARISPRRNSLVLFTVGKRSHHAVEEVVGAKRLTIAGWLHA